MGIDAVVIIPAAPVLVPAAAPGLPADAVEAVTQLRDDVRHALQRLPELDTAVLIASDHEPLLHDGGVATLASYGLPHVEAPIQVDEPLLAAIAARGQAPRLRSDRLDGDLAVLALLISAVHPGLHLVPATVGARVDAAALEAFATGIRAGAQASERRVGVVAAGDLAATLSTSSPGYLVHGATEWDEAATSAVRAGDVAAFAALGPDEAARVQARGWAPVGVALQIAVHEGVPLHDVRYRAPRGVGQLVAN